jgi:hypothetical protein
MHMIGPLEQNRGNLPEGSSAHAYSSIVMSFPEIALVLTFMRLLLWASYPQLALFMYPLLAWGVFRRMRPAEMVATLKELAQKVRLEAYRKSPQGPKKPRPKRESTTQVPHVSTAKLLRARQVHAATP